MCPSQDGVTNVPDTLSPLGQSSVAAPLILPAHEPQVGARRHTLQKRMAEKSLLISPIVDFPSLASMLHEKSRPTPVS